MGRRVAPVLARDADGLDVDHSGDQFVANLIEEYTGSLIPEEANFYVEYKGSSLYSLVVMPPRRLGGYKLLVSLATQPMDLDVRLSVVCSAGEAEVNEAEAQAAAGQRQTAATQQQEAANATSSVRCVSCPTGSTCVQGTTVETIAINPGWWRITNMTLDVRECKTAGVCIGDILFINHSLSTNGTNTSANLTNLTGYLPEWRGVNTFGDDLCAEGHAGPYCEVCYKGFYSSAATDHKCLKCSGRTVGSYLAEPMFFTFLVLFCIMFSILAATLVSMYTSDGDDEQARSSMRTRLLPHAAACLQPHAAFCFLLPAP